MSALSTTRRPVVVIAGAVVLAFVIVVTAVLLGGGDGSTDRAADPSGYWIAESTGERWINMITFEIECDPACEVRLYPEMRGIPWYEPAPLVLRDGVYTASGEVPEFHRIFCPDPSESYPTSFEFAMSANAAGGFERSTVSFEKRIVDPPGECGGSVEQTGTFNARRG